jgi:hypothetical protein
MAIENLTFWLDADEFRRNLPATEGPFLKREANKLVQRYIVETGPMPVSQDSDFVKEDIANLTE